MAIKEPKIIEMFTNGREYGALTLEEIMEHWKEMKAEDLAGGWRVACEYLSDYTDEDGCCRINLEKLVDEEMPDYGRTLTVCMIIFTLERPEE